MNMKREYIISQRTKSLAEKYNLLVYPSENLKYKIEIYKSSGKFIGYIGINETIDYPFLLKLVQKNIITKSIAETQKSNWIYKYYNLINSIKSIKYEYLLLWQ